MPLNDIQKVGKNPKIVYCKDYDFKHIRMQKPQTRKKGNQRSRIKKVYLDTISAFDIETTRLDDIQQSIMYIWQWQIGEYTIIGRTWDDFVWFRDELIDNMREYWLVVWVHNLSYEWNWLRSMYTFESGDVFAMSERKILKCDMSHHLEFRCSFLHSNMSLAEYTNKMKVKHGKLSGEEFDYSKTRYPWTELTERELEYCVNDVVGLCEALVTEMEKDNDNLYTIPLTSTGYVRRDAKKAMRNVPKQAIDDILPDIDLYHMLRKAFRGGNTHANRYYSDTIIKDVTSYDRSSSYPDVLINKKFPCTPFIHRGKTTVENMEKFIFTNHKAVLMTVTFTEIELIDEYIGHPYISKDKCELYFTISKFGRKIDKRGILNDNGRVLKADHITITITDVDYRIIKDMYCWGSMSINDLYISSYRYLPKPFRDLVIEYYRMKTELKGVKGQEIYYLKAKNKLNSLYGFCAQNPVKEELQYIGNTGLFTDSMSLFSPTLKTEEELLEESKRHSFVAYQWGVWTTAWARYELQQMINTIQQAEDNGDPVAFLYTDTDSVKFFGHVDFTEYNEQKKADSTASGAFATDPHGETHFMGVAEFDGHYREFATMGAKKYVYTDDDGRLHCTIAGVGKKAGAQELEESGGITAFKAGFIFHKAGGTEAIYNDIPPMQSVEIDGHTMPIISNVYLHDSEYTLGTTEEYMHLLKYSHDLLNFVNDPIAFQPHY